MRGALYFWSALKTDGDECNLQERTAGVHTYTQGVKRATDFVCESPEYMNENSQHVLDLADREAREGCASLELRKSFVCEFLHDVIRCR